MSSFNTPVSSTNSTGMTGAMNRLAPKTADQKRRAVEALRALVYVDE
jgi:hypothetical protein